MGLYTRSIHFYKNDNKKDSEDNLKMLKNFLRDCDLEKPITAISKIFENDIKLYQLAYIVREKKLLSMGICEHDAEKIIEKADEDYLDFKKYVKSSVSINACSVVYRLFLEKRYLEK